MIKSLGVDSLEFDRDIVKTPIEEIIEKNLPYKKYQVYRYLKKSNNLYGNWHYETNTSLKAHIKLKKSSKQKKMAN